MSDIKSVITLLCKHLHLSIGSSVKPEYFRLAKYNKGNDEVTQALWTTLNVLGRYAVRDKNIDDEFGRYDEVHATKLYFAFMQYPTIEFFGLSADDNNASRELLLALGWLLATKNVLNIAVKAKLATSRLGHEFSRTEAFSAKNDENHRSPRIDPSSEMNSIVERFGHVGHNIKAIAELTEEKIKLTTKIHAASISTSGLPHLSVHEIALAKKSFGNRTSNSAKEDEEFRKDLIPMATILETYMQWTKKEHVYYDWMTTVIEEKEREDEDSSLSSNPDELSSFVSLLRHVTKKKVHSIENHDISHVQTRTSVEPCVSRFLRSQQEGCEAETWIFKTTEQSKALEIDVETKMDKLTAELRKMLKSIPDCVEI